MRCPRRLAASDQSTSGVVAATLGREAQCSGNDERTDAAVGARLINMQLPGRVVCVAPTEVAVLVAVPYPVVVRKLLRVAARAAGKMADVHQIGPQERIGAPQPLLTVVGRCKTMSRNSSTSVIMFFFKLKRQMFLPST